MCCEYNYCVYFRLFNDGSPILLILYVVHMFIVVKSKKEIEILKYILSNEFDMRNHGAAKKIHQIELHQ